MKPSLRRTIWSLGAAGVLGQVFLISSIGVVQVLVSDPFPLCPDVAVPSPLQRICQAVRGSGRGYTLSTHEATLLCVLAAVSCISGCAAAAIVRRLNRARFKMKLWTGMVLIAVISALCVEGSSVWGMWRWVGDKLEPYVYYCSLEADALRVDASDSPEVRELKREMVPVYAEKKARFWRAWDFDQLVNLHAWRAP